MKVSNNTVLALPARLMNMLKKTKVFVICDSINSTWDIMSMDRNCIFYGTVEQVEEWLVEHSSTHEEQIS